MLSNSQVLLICSPIISINSYNPVPLEYSKRTMTWCRSIVPLSLQNMKNFFIRVRLFDRLHFFWAKRITSFAGKLPSYALAKSCERSELTTYQVTVMRKFEIEDNIPVCGRRRARCRRRIFYASWDACRRQALPGTIQVSGLAGGFGSRFTLTLAETCLNLR